MKDKIVLITGATSIIAQQAAIELAAMGATVLLHAQPCREGGLVLKALRSQMPNGDFDLYTADLSLQQDIRQMATAIQSDYEKIDVLVNYATTYSEERKLTTETMEYSFAVNHLAPFLLTHLLLPLLLRSDQARIINVSSHAHYTARFNLKNLQGEKEYNGIKAYCSTKLCNLLFTYALAQKLSRKNISVYSMHPGFTKACLCPEAIGEFVDGTLPDGADCIIYLASSKKIKNTTGLYFMSHLPIRSSGASYNRKYQQQLWKISERLTMIYDYGNGLIKNTSRNESQLVSTGSNLFQRIIKQLKYKSK